MPEDVAGSRRAYAVALLALALGGVLIVLAYGMTWVTVTVGVLPGSADATRELAISGRDLYAGSAMCGWVALACVAGVIATRSWGRTLVAVLGLLAGLAAAATAVWFVLDTDAAVTAGVADARSHTVGPAWLLAVVGGLLVVLATVATIVRGRQWPAMGARYERSAAARQRSDWDAQDAGEDPTDDLVE